jgi:phosphate transport system protein
MAPEHDETRSRYAESLEAVKRGTLELGALVVENTRRATEAMLENQVDLARRVIDADGEIDELYSGLERKVFEIIARQQPVAGDLRLLVSVTRILYEIERSGDLAVNMAKGLIHQDGYTLPEELHGLIARMGRGSIDLFTKGLDAFDTLDPAAGARLDREDDVVDDLVGDFYAAIARVSGDLGFDVAVELSRVGRYMERIADHAVNVAEHVTFIVTGSFPEDETVAVRDEN